jgi:transposase
MSMRTAKRSLSTQPAAAAQPEQLHELVRAQAVQIESLQRQLEWFRRQVFGRKSERVIGENDPRQMELGEGFPVPDERTEPTQEVPSHKRRIKRRDRGAEDLDGNCFDDSKVPVHVVVLPPEEAQGLPADAYEVIGEKISWRLGQRPGSMVAIKYVRPQIKIRESGALRCAPAPQGVIDGSRADVSLLSGLIVDKFVYHLPLYRQHQRMNDQGFRVARSWLTQCVHKALSLLEPIYLAQLDAIRGNRVIAMDEVPIKAGRDGPGKMKQGYFWPIYGENAEVCFPFYASRQQRHVIDALGLRAQPGGVLLSDGYSAYANYAKHTGVTHAQCWAHTRREFYEAGDSAREQVDDALDWIRAIYAIEEHIRDNRLTGEAKRLCRAERSAPLVEQFFAWVDQQFERQGLLPSNPFTKALAYTRNRRSGLQVFLTDPEVAVDTNHVERALRVIPMGRKNWLFCWTELGAKYAGIAQSLLVTCRLHDIDPHTYLIDVLQRISQHPASRVAELTPRLWKEQFASNPLRSDLYLSP